MHDTQHAEICRLPTMSPASCKRPLSHRITAACRGPFTCQWTICCFTSLISAFSCVDMESAWSPQMPGSRHFGVLRVPCAVVVRPSPTRAAITPRALLRIRIDSPGEAGRKIGACDILFSRANGPFFFFATELFCSPATGIKLRVTAGLSTAPGGPLGRRR